MKSVISAENVSKRYRVGSRQAAYSTLRDAFAETIRAPLQKLRRRLGQQEETIWALKDVTFDIEPTEVVGIIGHNGAGKSTLLKILSRITEPTSGRVNLYGKTGSLLEVGTGFHPELTGRENVFLNGAILGMKRTDIGRKFDEIVTFSEIENFIDTPVKFYSSGMYVRLAFAVAAHLEPEILIVDEVLSVGDMAFQQKCIQKMSQMRKQTKAIIFVSHSMISVRALCSRVMLLSQGKLAADGDPNTVVPLYEKLTPERIETREWRDEVAEGMGQIRIKTLRLLDAQGVERQTFEIGEKVNVVVEYDAVEPMTDVVAYAAIRRPDDFICVGSSTRLEGINLPPLEGPGTIEVNIPELLVIPGHYVLDFIFYDHNFDYRAYFLGRKRVEFNVKSDLQSLDGMYGVFYQKQDWKFVSKANTEPADVAASE
ncbi:MAG TPA: ABC transporter ATP-binding protein [Pyrinomonadaceae bacterium]